MASLLAGPIGLVLMGATCALVVSVLRSNWFFNESEKAMIPAALQSIAKEAILGILLIVLFSILGIVQSSYQRGSRNPRLLDALAFCVRYSA
jgi:hypothetical protein